MAICTIGYRVKKLNLLYSEVKLWLQKAINLLVRAMYWL